MSFFVVTENGKRGAALDKMILVVMISKDIRAK